MDEINSILAEHPYSKNINVCRMDHPSTCTNLEVVKSDDFNINPIHSISEREAKMLIVSLRELTEGFPSVSEVDRLHYAIGRLVERRLWNLIETCTTCEKSIIGDQIYRCAMCLEPYCEECELEKCYSCGKSLCNHCICGTDDRIYCGNCKP